MTITPESFVVALIISALAFWWGNR